MLYPCPPLCMEPSGPAAILTLRGNILQQISEKCYSLVLQSAEAKLRIHNFRGKMIPEELEKQILKDKEEGHLPFFVNCTTGTTVYGAYDPISEIAGTFKLKMIKILPLNSFLKLKFELINVQKKFTFSK